MARVLAFRATSASSLSPAFTAVTLPSRRQRLSSIAMKAQRLADIATPRCVRVIEGLIDDLIGDLQSRAED